MITSKYGEKQPLLQSDKYATYDANFDTTGSKDPLKRKSSFDPSRRVTLSWHNIEVFVKPQRGRFACCSDHSEIRDCKQLLHGVSGVAKPGQLLAIMGASGAGKTTLLNVLTNKNLRLLDVMGEVLVNGQNVGESIVNQSAYVQQDDLFIGTLKVIEHLTFQAMVRMDKHISYSEKMKRVDQVILELGLTKCRDTLIGITGSLKGISGGEAKRLAFASEVLTNPALMFCDEPTSGLDSFMSQNVVQVLRDMAEGGRTIVCTIHQPSSETFELFDNLLLLAEGKIAYQGLASKALEFFERAGLKCPMNYNPADFYIHNLAIVPGKEAESKQKVAEICKLFERESQSRVERTVSTTPSFHNTNTKSTSRYKASWITQFRAVMWRCWIGRIREPMVTKAQIIQSVVMGLLLGLVYLNQKYDQNGIQNFNGALFLVLMNVTFQNVYTVINSFTFEQAIFLREHWNGMYRTDIYFLCKTIAETPVITISAALMVTIIYWMTGFNPDWRAFLYYLLIMVLISLTGASFGYMMSAASPSYNVALSITTPLVMPMVLFGGFYLNAGSIPVYFVWIKYLSWLYYGNEALVINQWSSITNITCFTEGCQSTGKEVLAGLSFNEDNFFFDIGMLVVLMVFYRLLAFMALLVKSSRKT
ncbi:hypothetical protein JTE90_029423 [Oedothorax gibbosus]|uniref:ABC transporter domain-containing protein n=1 Tax=Oedothorax gibbosus TaxID=931172 RepID=A0AAV6U0H0_9ARAC|nr:hypothetical protein JTE90_029423 [Oedothorax gibbosus]